jgi:hypothetical protein
MKKAISIILSSVFCLTALTVVALSYNRQHGEAIDTHETKQLNAGCEIDEKIIITTSTSAISTTASTSATSTTSITETEAITQTSAETSTVESKESTTLAEVTEPAVSAETTAVIEKEPIVGLETMSEMDHLASSIVEQICPYVDANSDAPTTWNAWYRVLLFGDDYCNFSQNSTEERADYGWELTQNPNGWEVDLITCLTQDFGEMSEDFKLPGGVDEYSQFTFNTPSKLDQNNLGDRIVLTNGNITATIFFNGSALSVVTNNGIESGYAMERVPMPVGFVTICHTEHVEPEAFDERISSAIAAHRCVGAFDWRLVGVLDGISHLDFVTE